MYVFLVFALPPTATPTAVNGKPKNLFLKTLHKTPWQRYVIHAQYFGKQGRDVLRLKTGCSATYGRNEEMTFSMARRIFPEMEQHIPLISFDGTNFKPHYDNV